MMHAYHSDPELKSMIVGRMQAHMDADELVRGVGYENGRGCAVGCTLNAYNHKAAEDEMGFPEWVMRLCDTLHEGTSDEVWPTFQKRFLEAVPEGFSEWTQAERDIKRFILRRNIERVEALEIDADLKAHVLQANRNVVSLIERDDVTEEEWSAARSAAASAAASAESTWWAAVSAGSTAESAWWAAASARSAAASARSAARSAAASAGSTAESTWWAAVSAGSTAESTWWAAASAWPAAATAAARSARSAARSAGSAEFDAIAEELIRLVSV